MLEAITNAEKELAAIRRQMEGPPKAWRVSTSQRNMRACFGSKKSRVSTRGIGKLNKSMYPETLFGAAVVRKLERWFSFLHKARLYWLLKYALKIEIRVESRIRSNRDW